MRDVHGEAGEDLRGFSKRYSTPVDPTLLGVSDHLPMTGYKIEENSVT